MIAWVTSIEPGDQPPRTAAIGIVFGTEMRAQQHLFRADTCEKRQDEERREQHAGPARNASAQPSELISNPR